MSKIYPHKSVLGSIASNTIDKNGKVVISLTSAQSQIAHARFTPTLYTNAGHFIGTAPVVNTALSILQGEGGEYFMLNAYIPKTKYDGFKIDGDSLLITSDEFNRINLKPTGINPFITLGKISVNMRVDARRNILSDNFDFKFSVGEGSTHVDGIIKRDVNVTNSSNDERRSNHQFIDTLQVISLDPSSGPNLTTTQNSTNTISGAGRNPPFVEKRDIVYEFAASYDVGSDKQEAQRYSDQDTSSPPLKYDRRKAITDVFSLTLEAPNYLIETIRGTGVDIYGNVLDLNRNILPVGKEKDLTFKKNDDKLDAYKRIKALERRSLAYHFEINARKGPIKTAVGVFDPHQVVPPPDISSTDDFSRPRSRFFFDIDKEGQIKINVPASSETGNIPYLSRYENSSTVEALAKGKNANTFGFDGKLPENKDQRRDVYLDSFAFNGGSITVSDPENTTAFTAPIDRILSNPIRHGTVYHDIGNILSAFKASQQQAFLQFEEAPINTTLSQLTWPENFASPNIVISGPNANAGGRSGSMNFDGMVELNIGANTVDKQSLWLDTQGGVLGNVGRDLNHVSMGLNMSGDLLIQVGGCDVSSALPLWPGGDENAELDRGPCSSTRTDSRFLGKNFAFRPGAVDIRVLTDNGEATVVRIDNSGVTISTPSDLRFVAAQNVIIKGHQIDFDAEEINFYSNDPAGARRLTRSGQQIP